MIFFSVLRQIARLHKQLATALATSEAAVKQAKGVSDHCEQLMEEIEDLKVFPLDKRGK